jgi:hypothetical protein
MESVSSSTLQKLVVTRKGEAPKFPEGLRAMHVCLQTFMIEGPRALVERYLASDNCLDARDTLFPKCEWRRDYKYLGDIHVGTEVAYDLRLQEDLGHTYHLVGDPPPGFAFHGGILKGTAKNPSPILDIKIEARHIDSNLERGRTFQIRFFEGQSGARSFTDQDYIRWGYGPQLIDYDPSLVYFRNFQSSGKTLSTPFEEAKEAARRIQKQANGKPIHLLVSGGIDSQSMTQAFVAAGVPFTGILMIDRRGCNAQDVHYAKLYYQKIGRNLRCLDVDFAAYIRSYDYVDMALTYRFNNPEYGLLLNLMNVDDCFPVYAGRPISISTNLSGDQVIGLAVDETWSRARFLERTRREGCAEFLVHTAELMESFLSLDYARNVPKGRGWTYNDKLMLLKEGGFDICGCTIAARSNSAFPTGRCATRFPSKTAASALFIRSH